ncbi:hypothetical protein N7491_001737 [Penicillium cf. griseofulvum]|uniref:Uncharacterized protein n=1 Tax=Penicillium cf. griseofulvum TaxID=2972120 RepID=A0A9W9JC87_9EURO|nr:hypothetical protein N7472_006865 [Penicillium cf. griseofulvum]KAJ5445655.1 hypothetical protein N7491_001737 [Penicillium cf. griseofulvum]KAJ5447378.1 hypothetical protein N7445_002199 [Penicillium cf. griseofulvum]
MNDDTNDVQDSDTHTGIDDDGDRQALPDDTNDGQEHLNNGSPTLKPTESTARRHERRRRIYYYN